jgi:hypothetical protein
MTAQSREMSFWQNIIWDESPVRLGIAQKIFRILVIKYVLHLKEGCS